MPIVGSFAGASARAYGLGAGGLAVPVGYNSIASTTVGASSVPSITFSGIPQNYKHLQIRAVVKPAGATSIALTTNLSSFARRHQMYFFSGNKGASTDTDNQLIYNDPALVAVGIIDILDYSNTNKYKTIKSMNGYQNGDTFAFFGMITTLETSLSGINSITLTGTTNNMVQMTRVSLYGIAG
jgi:hypothetical protein